MNTLLCELSPFTKFWYHGVDIMVNAASALLVACIVGLFWFVRKELDLWYDHKRAAQEQAMVIDKQFFELKIKALDLEDWNERLQLVSQVEKLMLNLEVWFVPAGREFHEKWFSNRRIYAALADRNSDALKKWHEFISDLANVVPHPTFRHFPLLPVRVHRFLSRKKARDIR